MLPGMSTDVAVLHRHWMWANRFRVRFDGHPRERSADQEVTFFEDWIIDLMSWYGHLHVTIEGWKELGLVDSTIDALLSSPNVDSLRRLRNAVWHFQRDWVDSRILGFMVQPGVVDWVREVNRQFGRFFQEWHDAWEKTHQP